jgi:Tol biopolymer transport system component
VFVWNRSTGRASRLTTGNGASWGADLSDDGSRVSFLSDASDLVADDTNGQADLFVTDRVTGVTTRIPGAGGRYWGASISGDGSTVAFASTTDAHAPTGTTDTNAAMDIFRWDVASRRVLRITNGDAPSNSDPTLSDDGRAIAFNSKATDIAAGERDLDANDDLFLWNASTATVSRLTTSGAMSLADTMYPEVSGDGRTVAFSSQADDLDPAVPAAESHGTWNVHVWHRAG